MSNTSYEERFQRFTEACEQLRPLHDADLQEAILRSEEEAAFDTKMQALEQQSKTAGLELHAAQETDKHAVLGLYVALGEILMAEKDTENEHKDWLDQRDQALSNNRVRQAELLGICARGLVELNPLFKEIVKDEWLDMEDGVAEQTETTAGNVPGDEGYGGGESSHGEEDHEPSSSVHNDSVALPPARTSEEDQASDYNPFSSEDEPMTTARRSSTRQSHASHHGDLATGDQPVGDVEPGEANPRASSETLGSEAVKSATLPRVATATPHNPESSRAGHERNADEALTSRTSEKRRERTKKRKRVSNEGGTASEDENDKRQRAKTTRRKQHEMNKPDPIIRKLQHHRLASTYSMTMNELSESRHRHFIMKDPDGHHCIIRCDVCGLHFQESLKSGLGHLKRAPQHSSLRSSRLLPKPTNQDVFHYMGIRLVDCSDELMEAHNSSLRQDIDAGEYTLRSALNSDKIRRLESHHSKFPTVLLPRSTESNRPRLVSDPGDGSAVIRRSTPPQPQSEGRPNGFVPGQVYWVKQRSAEYYRIALALPLHDLKEIGLPRRSVAEWTNGEDHGLVYDDTIGCFLQPSRSQKDGTWHPMLYLDFQNERSEPEVAFIKLSFTRPFERDEIGEGKSRYDTVYEYLDQAQLWFMVSKPAKEEEENTPTISRARSNAQGDRASHAIEIDDDSDGEDLPPMDVVIDRTPTKPKPESAKRSQKGKGRDTRPLAGRSSEMRGYSYSNPPPGLFSRQTRQSTLGVEQEVGPAPEAAME